MPTGRQTGEIMVHLLVICVDCGLSKQLPEIHTRHFPMFRRLAQLWNNSAQSAGWNDPLAELLPVM